jgi:hypothetical protein
MRIVYVLIAATSIVACARAGRPASSDRNLLTRDEIARVAGAQNLYDVIARARPEYLRDRGRTTLIANANTKPVVFVNDVEHGPLESLRAIQPDAVMEVQFFNSTAAVSRFGSQYGAGVIHVRTR